MGNIKKLVKKHNNNILRKNDTNKQTCNCRANNTCPLDGTCLSSNTVYSAEILTGNNQQGDQYFGICQTEFKIRLTIKTHLKTDKKKKTLNFQNIYGT